MQFLRLNGTCRMIGYLIVHLNNNNYYYSHYFSLVICKTSHNYINLYILSICTVNLTYLKSCDKCNVLELLIYLSYL